MTRSLFAATLVALSFAGAADAASYKIDANHTQVLFTYNHFGYSNQTGRFNQVTGEFQFEREHPAASSINVQLPMSSLSTGVAKLDADLSSDGFFDVAKFPTASFRSNQVKVLDKDHLQVAGDLSIHGVTRPVSFAVTINKAGMNPMRKVEMAGFDAVATIKRSEFGVTGMLPMVSDEVQLRITMETRAEAPAPTAGEAAKKG